MRKLKNGFTMVELLVTIFIVSLLFTIGGMYVLNTIKSSKDTVKEVNESVIKEITNTYVKEFSEEVSWVNDNEEYKSTCILIDLLVEKGYLEDSKLGEVSSRYIKIVKDNNDNIISEEFVESNQCGNILIRVPIPNNKICNRYSSNEFVTYSLIDPNISHSGYTYDEETSKASIPGIYPVELKLNENHIWSDGTREPKIVKCTINKKIPVVELDSYLTTDVGIETFKINMTSNVNGDVKIKVSNNDYLSTNIKEGIVEKDKNFEIEVTTLATRISDTYITITVIPKGEDANYYYSTSVVHKVSVKENFNDLEAVDIPTAETMCNSNLIYNGNSLKIAKDNSGYGYVSNTNYAVNAGEHTVIATLKEGYKWSDNSLSNKKFICSIKKRDSNIELKKSDKIITDVLGIVGLNKSIDIDSIRGYYKLDGSIIDIPGVISIESTEFVLGNVFQHSGYKEGVNSLYKATLIGLKAGDNQEIIVKFIPNDQENFNEVSKKYMVSVKNNYTLTYNTATNGGNACSPSTKEIVYGEAYGDLCTPSRDGYEFDGWYTSSKDRNTKVTKNTVLNTAKNVTIYAHFKKTVTITLNSYNGSNAVTSSVSGDMYNNAKSVSITLPSFERYKDSCDSKWNEWEKIGWSTSTSADGNVEYSTNTTYDFSNNMTLYAKYKITSSFIYSCNGGEQVKSNRHETSYFNSSGESHNMGPWTETVDKDGKRSGCTFVGWYLTDDKSFTRVVKPGETKTIKFSCGDRYQIDANWGAGCR